MSVPPQVIQIKRKRNDDAPVAFLRIEQNTKRHRSGDFLYQRRNPVNATDIQEQAPTRPPTIQSTRPGEEKLPLEAVKRSHGVAGGSIVTPVSSNNFQQSPIATNGSSQLDGTSEGIPSMTPTAHAPAMSRITIEPRRFHLSRKHLAERQSAAASRLTKTANGLGGGLGPATFVERSIKRRRNGEPRAPSIATSHPHNATVEAARHVAEEQMQLDDLPAPPQDEAPRKLKPPSRRAAVSTRSGTPKLPDSLMNRWDTDMDRLAREMNDYTLELIARDLDKIKERDDATAAEIRSEAQGPLTPKKEDNGSHAVSSPSPRRFKPHAPAKRYGERHPEAAAAAAAAAAAETAKRQDEAKMALDGASDTDEDEDEYIIETYVRVEAGSVMSQATPDQVGLLVLDNDPDIDFFYGEESDSEEEYEDDEDENAENYYTADYPDDEVASGDEFDRDTYMFQTSMAEFDGASESESNDEGFAGRLRTMVDRKQDLGDMHMY